MSNQQLTSQDSKTARRDGGNGERLGMALRFRRPKGVVPFTIVTLLVVAFTLAVLFVPASRETTGLLAIGLMLSLMFWGVHVGAAMGIAGVLGVLTISGPNAAQTALTSVPYGTVSSWSLSVLPLFMLVGMIIAESGLAKRLYRGSQLWLGWVPGNLAVSSTLAGSGLAATSGTTVGITYALGRIGLPEMFRAGYSPRLAMGSIMVVGTLGQLIPPSILMVLYATIAQTPMGPQLMSGVVPGIVLALLYITLIVLWTLIVRNSAPKATDIVGVGWGERLRSLVGMWPLVVLIGVILGGMFSGLVTPTEAAAAGAVAAAVILLVLRGRKGYVRRLGRSLTNTLSATGSVFLLLIGTDILSRALAVSGIARGVAQGLESMGLSAVGFLVLVGIVYLLLGTAIEPTPLMLMTVPILLPVVEHLDINLIWFGVYVVLLGELGVLTPPIGILAFVVHRIVSEKSVAKIRKVSLNDVWMAALLFMPAPIVLAILLLLFPDLVTWLPDQLVQRTVP